MRCYGPGTETARVSDRIFPHVEAGRTAQGQPDQAVDVGRGAGGRGDPRVRARPAQGCNRALRALPPTLLLLAGVVEVVARALCEARTWKGAWDRANEVERNAWTYDALAAINAIASLTLTEEGEGR